MPSTAFALQDDRLHDVRQGLERELCSLSLLPPFTGGASEGAGGPYVVLVTGELHSLEVSFNVRLSVFRFGGPLAASVDYSVWRSGLPDLIASTPLALTLAVELPGEGGGSSGSPPPQPRAAVAVADIFGTGYGTVSKLRITALRFDELHQTTIDAPPPVPLVFDVETFRARAEESANDLDE